MPVYEYFCPSCNKEFELRRSMIQADAPGACPRCGSEGPRLVSAFGSKVDFYVRPSTQAALRRPADKEDKK